MILKDLDPYFGETAAEKSGYKAEKQMAFYLEQRFSRSEEFFVLNNIRFIGLNGLFSQIDHLVFSRYGVVIVESKSVSSSIKYESNGQWMRLWNNHWTGMRSPVQQALEQGIALREVLQCERESLRQKVLLGLIQGGFRFMPIDCLIAVSDSGKIVLPPGKNPFAGIVMKADQVTDRIMELFETYKSKDSVFAKEPSWKMSLEDVRKVCAFLIQNHIPFEKNTKSNKSVFQENSEPSQEKTTSAPVQNSFQNPLKDFIGNANCPECSGSMKILWGNRFKNYYWHCENCGKNVSINLKCPVCGEHLKLRKQKNEYFIYCEPCGISTLYFAEN